MKKRFFLMTIALLGIFYGQLHSQNYLETRVKSAWEENVRFEKVELFIPSTRSIQEDAHIAKTLENGILLELNEPVLKALVKLPPAGIQLSLPDGQGGLELLDLLPSDFLSQDFSLRESDDVVAEDYLQGAHYQGTIHNAPGSLTAISFFEGDVMGFYSTPTGGNRILGKISEGPLKGLFVLYAVKDLKSRPEFSDLAVTENGVEEAVDVSLSSENKKNGSGLIGKCVTTYVEVDNTLANNFSSFVEVVDYVLGTTNQINTLYLNENIVFKLNGIHIWMTGSPFNHHVDTSSVSGYKSLTTHEGDADLVQLWLGYDESTGYGGMGTVGTSPCIDSSLYSVARMYGFFNHLPAYTWDVNIATHEWGHNLGSRHTHWCGWTGGAIDNCSTTEGTCSPGPSPASGGTIMSYCYITPFGVNFSLGFGPQPGDLIRARVSKCKYFESCTLTKCEGEVKYVDIQDSPFMYVIVNSDGKGDLIKVRKPAGSGHNMFGIKSTASGYTTIPGYTYFEGSQQFESEITNVLYTGNQTIVTLMDGKMVKVSGTGGSSYNMFGLIESASGFTSSPGYPYYIGSAKFLGHCNDLFYTGNELVMAFSSRKILKVAGTGGAGANMFAVTETAGGFNGNPGFAYYLGDGMFQSQPVELMYVNGKTLIGFVNGKILKVNGTGGSAHNLFGVSESLTAFTGLPGYVYYIGDANFKGYVTAWDYDGSKLLMGFSNNKMLKINGLGGT
ncbi:MAG TPA: hypothetical protein ENJ82_01890, partial [Bacteroidetes bacterium]|nr:hypothetical protein [Bacteroidota bacterium]